MHVRRRLVRMLFAASVLLAVPFCLVTLLYFHTLHGLGDLPQPAPERALPRLIALGIWEDIGETGAQFEVEAAWPWTPVLDLALHRDPRTTVRPGANAANRVSGLWLASRPRAGKGTWHLRRAALDVWLSRHWSASDLTREMAFRSYFGRRAVGIDQAAAAYFGKPPEALTSGEAALLVGLLASPHHHSPDRSPELALKRRNYVLEQWATSGLITPEVSIAESSKPLGVRPLPDSGDQTQPITP